MRLGTAWADVTPTNRLTLCGQMTVRWGEYTHDPLTVNAVALEDDAGRCVIVSCDLVMMPNDFVRSVQAECEAEHGIAADAVLIACTHTHVGPNTIGGLAGEVDPDYIAGLGRALVDVVGRALHDLQDVTMYAGRGWIEEMGFNRRGRHRDGQVDMYYGCWNDDFDGLEGPRDGEVGVLCARTADDEVKAVVASFSTHPNSNEGESYYSADVPGAVRAHVRRNLGERVGVVYLTGAAGNTAPTDLENDRERQTPWRGEAGLKRSGLYLGSEIVKVVAGAHRPLEAPAVRLAQRKLAIPIRPYPATPPPRMWDHEHFHNAREEWARFIEAESPVEVRVNVVRVGAAAVCTSPAELYVEHGIAIKHRSPARVTLISELCDGYCGYVPTKEAFPNGGYSTWPASTCMLAEDAGDQIVDATAECLEEAFA